MAPLISEPTARFLESGLSITIATRDGELQPDGAVAPAARVHDDGMHVTLFVYEQAAPALLRNLTVHPEIAAVFDLPTSHRACQVKGVFESSRPARPEERALVDRQVEGFAADLEAIGVPRALSAPWKAWPCVALEVRVTRLYEQTPGPGAGEPLR